MFDLTKTAYGAKTKLGTQNRITMLPLEDVQDNEKNFYGIREIEQLADSIRMVGLLDPIRVVRAGRDQTGSQLYRIVSGHRRYHAYVLLSAEEDADTDYLWIPAMVMENMDDLRESFALISANSSTRELTDSEKLQQEKQLRETLLAMKDAGMDVPKNFSQFMADTLGTSRNDISRRHTVNEHLGAEDMEKLEKGEISFNTAYQKAKQNAGKPKNKPQGEWHKLTEREHEIVKKLGWDQDAEEEPTPPAQEPDIILAETKSVPQDGSYRWHRDEEPRADGAYAVDLAVASRMSMRVLWRVNGKWCLVNDEQAEISETCRVTRWVRLPEE